MAQFKKYFTTNKNKKAIKFNLDKVINDVERTNQCMPRHKSMPYQPWSDLPCHIIGYVAWRRLTGPAESY
jgi:hypothetical protein